MRTIRQIACALFVASAAAWAQSVPFTSAYGSKTVSATGPDISVSASVYGEVAGGTGGATYPGGPTALARASVTAGLQLRLFDTEQWVATFDASAHSVSRSRLDVRVGGYRLSEPWADDIHSSATAVQAVIFRDSATFSLLSTPIWVSGECGAGVAWSVAAVSRREPAPVSASLEGQFTPYALLKLRVRAYLAFAVYGAVGDGELLRVRCDSTLRATAAGPEGELLLAASPRVLRVWVYIFMMHSRTSQSRYLINATIPEETYSLIDIG